MSLDRAQLKLRKATSQDGEFIYRLIESTMRRYVEKIWGSFSEDFNRKNTQEFLETGTYAIIQYQNQDIGALAVQRHASHIDLAQIYILPSHQNRGIGTLLIRDLVCEAQKAALPLRLRVLSGNPAQRLYEREGFSVTAVTPERVFLERSVTPTTVS